MSKYTFTLNEILEGGDIFDFDYPFYNDIDGAKEQFEDKFKNIFMFHEIGYDEIDMFKHYLKTKLIVLYPYYYQLYQTELRCKDIDFMLNKDLKETFTRELTGAVNKELEQTSNRNDTINQTNNEENTITNNVTSNINSNLKDIYSASNNVNVQDSSVNNGISSVDINEGYLTSVQKTDDNQEYNLEEINTSTANNNNEVEENKSNTIEGTNTSSNTSSEIEDITNTQSETTELISQGNIGVTSSAELLEKWRRVIIDIDMMLINDLATLFLKIY